MISSLVEHIIQEIKGTQSLEWIAALFGVMSVLFAQRNHILLYPSGLISTAIYAYLWSRKEAGLYAEALLNLYYFVMTIYGWWFWQKGRKQNQEVSISTCNRRDQLRVLVIVLLLWSVLYALLLQTNSTVPIWDSLVSALACAGMWLLAKRKIENWLLLNASNFIAIPLFVYKGYYVTMLLTVILFVVAIFGYIHWRTLYNRSATSTSSKIV